MAAFLCLGPGNRLHHWPLATTLAALCEIVYTADCLNVLSLCLVSIVLGLKNILYFAFKLLWLLTARFRLAVCLVHGATQQGTVTAIPCL